MKEVTYTNGIPICPTCDKPSYRTEEMTTTTCMGFSVMYNERGENISQDPNVSTTRYFCQDCRENFSVKSQYGNSEYVEGLKLTYS